LGLRPVPSPSWHDRRSSGEFSNPQGTASPTLPYPTYEPVRSAQLLVILHCFRVGIGQSRTLLRFSDFFAAGTDRFRMLHRIGLIILITLLE
jgi:hypothetical protein